MQGFGNTASRVIQEAAKGAYETIMPQGSTEKRVALARGEGEASTNSIVEVSCVIHAATGYKCSVAITRYRELRRRGASSERLGTEHVRGTFLHPLGGVGCTRLLIVAWLSGTLDGMAPLFAPRQPEGRRMLFQGGAPPGGRRSGRLQRSVPAACAPSTARLTETVSAGHARSAPIPATASRRCAQKPRPAPRR